MIDDNDVDFYETVYDSEGNPRKIVRPQIDKKEKSSGFTYYDGSHGHCGLCGSLTCNGNCFK